MALPRVFRAPSTTISDPATVALVAARTMAAASASTKRRPKPPKASFTQIMQTPEGVGRAPEQAAKGVLEGLRCSLRELQRRRQNRTSKRFERLAERSLRMRRSLSLRRVQY